MRLKRVPTRRRQSAEMENKRTTLQWLDFDCSIDTEGVLCWDALASPQPGQHHGLLQEVALVLGWAYRLGPQGPGALEDGADWDFDLQATWLGVGQSPQSPQAAAVAFDVATGQMTLSTPTTNGHKEDRRMEDTRKLDRRLELSLSLSATPAFAQALREPLDLP